MPKMFSGSARFSGCIMPEETALCAGNPTYATGEHFHSLCEPLSPQHYLLCIPTPRIKPASLVVLTWAYVAYKLNLLFFGISFRLTIALNNDDFAYGCFSLFFSRSFFFKLFFLPFLMSQ